MKAWITKYALTYGIEEVEGECRGAKSFFYEHSGREHAYGNDWHRTRESAVSRAEEMRVKKIASMKKRLSELERMEFKA